MALPADENRTALNPQGHSLLNVLGAVFATADIGRLVADREWREERKMAMDRSMAMRTALTHREKPVRIIPAVFAPTAPANRGESSRLGKRF